MRNIWDTIAAVIKQPTKFFKSITKEKDFKDALWLYIIFLAINAFFIIIQNVISKSLVGIPFGLFGLAIGLGVFFLGVLITQLFFQAFGGKGQYKDTFNLLVYAGVPGMVLGILMNIFLTFSIAAQTTWLKIAFLVPYVFFILAAVIWNIVLVIIGGSIIHRVSKGKAFVAGILLPFVLVIALTIVIIIFMLFLAGLGIFAASAF
jgi:hypothetical protein